MAKPNFSSLTRVIEPLLPNHYCAQCHLNCEKDKNLGWCFLCDDCQSQLQRNTTACSVCAEPLPKGVKSGVICGQCLNKPPAYQQSISPLVYDETLHPWVLAIKANQSKACQLAAEYIHSALPINWPVDIISPIPMSLKKIKQRGANHSASIAAYLQAKLLHSTLELHLLSVSNNPISQKQLNRRQRQTHLQKAFHCEHHIIDKNVLLIDDVMTTGATLHYASQALKRSGAKAVYAATLARTSKLNEPER